MSLYLYISISLSIYVHIDIYIYILSTLWFIGTSNVLRYIYYAHLASVRFEHSVCRGSLMATYIILFAWLAEHSLLHWCQQCVIVAIYGSIIN